MKYIAKTDLNCSFGILQVGDSFEADPNDERVAQLMVSGKVVSAEADKKPEPRKAKKNAKKAPRVEVAEENSETEPVAEDNSNEE